MTFPLLEPRTIIVSDKFVKAANHFKQKLNWKANNHDALLLEYELVTKKITQKPLNWRHDFIYNDMKIDAKELNHSYFNIQNGKLAQYRESIMMNELTHFLFYNTSRDWDVPLKSGDQVEIYPIAICDARKIIKSAAESHYEDTEAFVWIETIQMLGEEYEEKKSEPGLLREKSENTRSIST